MNNSVVWTVNAYVTDNTIATTGDTIVQLTTALSTIILNSTSTLSSSLSTATSPLLSVQSSSFLSSPSSSSASLPPSSSSSSSTSSPSSSSSSSVATAAATATRETSIISSSSTSSSSSSSTSSSSSSSSLSSLSLPSSSLSSVILANEMEIMAQDDCRFRPTLENYITIVSFCIIFCLSVVGNAIVVAVILQQHSMRSVTNIYLLNLAISDLMLSVICMPPTLVSSVIYCWMFGDLLCKLFAYLQPVVVTASAYTLAVIAFERYYAICKPLHSRIWHTRSHAYTMIALVWLISVLANLLMLFMYELQTYNVNGLTCAPKHRPILHFGYQIYMTSVLLLIPLCIMIVLYGSVIHSLRLGMKMDHTAATTAAANSMHITPRITEHQQQQSREDSTRNNLKTLKNKNRIDMNCFYTSMKQLRTNSNSRSLAISPKNVSIDYNNKSSLRSTHSERSILAKQRVIKMLIVIVIIFFCCWTPNYMWWLLLTAQDSFRTFDIWNSEVNTAITVLCYISSCANPITYCFLNKKFRTALLVTFGCLRKNSNQYLPEPAMDTLTQKKSTDEETNVIQRERIDQHNQEGINAIHSKTVLYRTGSSTTTIAMTTEYPERKRTHFETARSNIQCIEFDSDNATTAPIIKLPKKT
ncbi:Cholecystokinin receptor type [Dirofilaria immitis]